MKRNIILHLGAEKTGSTSLQHFLEANDARLMEQGFAYCRSLGRPNNRKLCLLAMDADRETQLHKVFGLRSQPEREAFAREQEGFFNEEVTALPSHVHTLILSNEHCRSNLIYPTEARRIMRLLRPHCENLRLVVYLRRQVDMAVSHYSSYLKTGNHRPTVLPEVSRETRYFNYRKILELWLEVIDKEQVALRIPDDRERQGWDVIADFLEVCGLPDPSRFQPVSPRNRSLDPLGQELLRHINMDFPMFSAGRLNDARRALISYLQENHSGAGRRPNRASAREFQAVYDADNEWIRSVWFPERTRLFSDDFSCFPETEAPPPDQSRLLEAALPLLRHLLQVNQRLQEGEAPEVEDL